MADSTDSEGTRPYPIKPFLGQVGNYELLKKIADGGMGSIFLGRNTQNGAFVAVKVMSPTYVANPILVKRFEQEFQVASRFTHPNLVRALDYGETKDSPYLVMEFVDGESLGTRVEREGALGELQAIKIIAQVAQGLNRIHKENLVHRDVKPDNILLRKDGVAKLIDLGLVKGRYSGDMNLTRSGRGLGTPNFMAPEQFRDAKNADLRCDIYSLGATLYTLLTGELPYKSVNPLDAWMKKVQNELQSPRELNPKISQRTDWAIRRAMNGDPSLRPANCREFIEDLTGRSTRKSSEGPALVAKDLDNWYLSYTDEEGAKQVVRGTTKSIRKSFRDGILEDPLRFRVSRSKTGPFEEFKSIPEFRDLVLILPKPDHSKGLGFSDGSQGIMSDTDSSTDSSSSARIPAWIYWAIGLIVILCVALGLFLLFR